MRLLQIVSCKEEYACLCSRFTVCASGMHAKMDLCTSIGSAIETFLDLNGNQSMYLVSTVLFEHEC